LTIRPELHGMYVWLAILRQGLPGDDAMLAVPRRQIDSRLLAKRWQSIGASSDRLGESPSTCSTTRGVTSP